MIVSLVLFVAYTLCCIWAIFMRGAEVLDGFIISGRSGKSFGARRLRFSMLVIWLIGFGLVLVQVLYGPGA